VEFLTLNVALAYAMHLLSPIAKEARKPTINFLSYYSFLVKVYKLTSICISILI
jgi:hypothetical protein